MKKILALLLVLSMVVAFAACAGTGDTSDASSDASSEASSEASSDDSSEATSDESSEDEVKVMTYEEYVAAELQSEVVVETYIQAKQGWWEKDGIGVATFYTQNEEGAYFIYEMPCSQEDYNNKLVVGAKIRVTGAKAEWDGEVEIIDATYEVLEGTWNATALDVTELLGTDELIDNQNKFVVFKGLTVKSISYKNDQPGDDIYVTFTYNEKDYDFCVEVYLTGPDSDVYKAVGELKAGDVVDVEGFLYWYQGVNTHITSVTAAE